MRRVWLITPQLFVLVVLLQGLGVGGCAPARTATVVAPDVDVDAPPDEPWRARRARGTKLAVTGPSPESAPPITVAADRAREGMSVVTYASGKSGSLTLRAVLAVPPTTPETPDTPTERRPAVMLFHSGFALHPSHLEWATAFVRAGFVVMLPSWRGENGNPGAYELWMGEVDDARAATQFLASQPEVDVDRMYLFGHSAGGGLASLLALDPDMPYRIIATSNGVYAGGTFGRWHKDDPRRVPFPVDDLFERQLRAIVPNAHELARPLLILAGTEDAWTLEHATMVAARAPKGRVEIVKVPGDHSTSAAPALEEFLRRVIADANGGAGVPAPALSRMMR